MGTVVDKVAQTFVGVAGVYQQHMGALLIILADQMVGEERLAATRRAEDELVAVGRYSSLHRLVGNVEMQRFPGQTVHHLYSEGGQRRAVVGLAREEAHRRLYEGVERFFRRKIGLVARHRRPEQRRAVDGVVAWHTTHSRKLTADIVFDAPQFLGVVAPRHDITMRPDACQSVGMGLVQVTVYPFLVDRVAAAVLGKTVHVAGRLLEAGKILVVAVYEAHTGCICGCTAGAAPRGRQMTGGSPSGRWKDARSGCPC